MLVAVTEASPVLGAPTLVTVTEASPILGAVILFARARAASTQLYKLSVVIR